MFLQTGIVLSAGDLEYDELNVSYEEGKERFTYYLVTIHLLFETVVLFCFSQR